MIHVIELAAVALQQSSHLHGAMQMKKRQSNNILNMSPAQTECTRCCAWTQTSGKFAQDLLHSTKIAANANQDGGFALPFFVFWVVLLIFFKSSGLAGTEKIR